MLADGHARNAIATVPFLMARYTGQLEDVEVPARIVAMSSADDMRETLAHFEAVYAKINHRVSRHGAVGITITELGLTATADKVNRTLERRSLGMSDPRSAHKGEREVYWRALASR